MLRPTEVAFEEIMFAFSETRKWFLFDTWFQEMVDLFMNKVKIEDGGIKCKVLSAIMMITFQLNS